MTLPLPLELPVLPVPRERALLALLNPDATEETYLAVVEGDPALTATVLRAANAASTAEDPPVLAAADGVRRLGLSAVHRVLATTLAGSQFASIEVGGIDADDMWRYLLACALLTEAQTRDEEERPVAFTAGLLHDLGRLAMAAQAPTRYLEIVRHVEAGGSALDAEHALFGISHADFGRRICEHWGLPGVISRAVGDHHEVEIEGAPATAAGEHDLVRRLALARWVALGLGLGDGVQRPAVRQARAEEHPLLLRVGGRRQLMASIRWFRASTAGRRRPAA